MFISNISIIPRIVLCPIHCIYCCCRNLKLLPIVHFNLAEVMCLAPPDYQHAVWNHFDKKNTMVSCEEGFQLQPTKLVRNMYPNVTDSVKLVCGTDGQWSPRADHFECVGMWLVVFA